MTLWKPFAISNSMNQNLPSRTEKEIVKRGTGRVKKIWNLYLEKCADFLEDHFSNLSSLIQNYMSEECEKRNINSETAKIFCDYAVEDLKLRIIEYRATFRAYRKDPKIIDKYMRVMKIINIDDKLLYGCDTKEEYKKILENIIERIKINKKDKEIAESLLKEFKTFPCNCLLREPENTNYLPGFVIAQAINDKLKHKA